MKKQLIGAIALITMSVAASAATSSIEGITVSHSENCSDGYVIKSEREGISKVVTYDSCLNTGMVVSDGSESAESAESVEEAVDLLGDTVDIGGTDYYFPAGYTTPTVALGGTCETGVTEGSCEWKGITELGEGYLNVVETSSHLSLYNNQLTNVDSLSNLTSAGGSLALFGNQLTDVDGLSNLTSVGSHLYLSSNQLANVDGLSNLTSVGSILYLNNNPDLSDLSGLNNLTSVGSYLALDNREYEVKLDADSYLCVNFDTKVADSNGSATLTKSNVCND